MHFMLQKEVVQRMAAAPGSKSYGRLGIMLGCYLDIESLFDVDRLAFEPPPAVTSAVVRLVPQSRPLPIADEALLSRLVAAAFSKRRKTLRNALKNEVLEADLLAVGVDPSVRPEQVAVASWIALGNRIANRAQA
jgi:16S rRNA (adenine1518-N6/adenine1519-N6)-dimethyltransferase